MNKRLLVGIGILIALILMGYVLYLEIPKHPTPLPSQIDSPKPDISIEGMERLEVEFPLKKGLALYADDYHNSIVGATTRRVYVSNGEQLAEINNPADISAVTGAISTEAQALAFVRFVTGKNFDDLEATERHRTVFGDLLTAPSVARKDGGWVIERDRLQYPDATAKIPARLVRVEETIAKDNTYSQTVIKILLEGDTVDNVLPYYE